MAGFISNFLNVFGRRGFTRGFFSFGLLLVFAVQLISLASADGDHHHKKVIIHVPYKIHTIHHHHIKKIPIYHYHEDHHHHHHHHEKKEYHHEELGGHEYGGLGNDWD